MIGRKYYDSLVVANRGGERPVMFKCGCCREETNDDDAEYVYQGMDVSQYICPECQHLPFKTVWTRIEEDGSPSYIGDRLTEEVLPWSKKKSINL